MFLLNRNNVIWKILLAVVIIANIFNVKAYALVSPTEAFYVNDYANILNAETERYITNINKQLNYQTGAQIVVVTVKNLEGDSLEEYATKLFRKFGIGDETKNNGLLLLLALEERQFRVEVGYGLEGILPDAKTGRMQDEYIIPYLKQNDWNNGIRNGFNAFLKVLTEEYNVDVDGESPEPIEKSINSDYITFGFMGLPVISVIVGAILRIIKKSNKISNTKVALISIAYIIIVAIIYTKIFNVTKIEGVESIAWSQLIIAAFAGGFNGLCLLAGMANLVRTYWWTFWRRILRRRFFWWLFWWWRLFRWRRKL